jgi:hypothetical protein
MLECAPLPQIRLMAGETGTDRSWLRRPGEHVDRRRLRADIERTADFGAVDDADGPGVPRSPVTPPTPPPATTWSSG